MTPRDDVNNVRKMRFVNSTGKEMEIWVEPLGDRVLMPIGVTFEVVVTDELGDDLEIEMSEHGMTITGWIRSISLLSEGGALSVWEIPAE